MASKTYSVIPLGHPVRDRIGDIEPLLLEVLCRQHAIVGLACDQLAEKSSEFGNLVVLDPEDAEGLSFLLMEQKNAIKALQDFYNDRLWPAVIDGGENS